MDKLTQKVITSFLRGVASTLGSEVATEIVNTVRAPLPTGQNTNVPVSYLGTVFVDPSHNWWFRNYAQLWFLLSQPGALMTPPAYANPTSHMYLSQSDVWYADTALGWYVYTAPGRWVELRSHQQ